jgi:hypothetical protein
VRKVVLDARPQLSHRQWWRISPPTTNSETSGAIMGSPQWGQRIDAAKLRIAASFGISLWSCMATGLLVRFPEQLLG